MAQYVKCPGCNGDGYYTATAQGFGEEQLPCELCNGEGSVPYEEVNNIGIELEFIDREQNLNNT